MKESEHHENVFVKVFCYKIFLCCFEEYITINKKNQLNIKKKQTIPAKVSFILSPLKDQLGDH